MSLDTLANVKTRIGVTGANDDALLSALMDSADAWVAHRTGRDFAGGTFTEYFPGGVDLVVLANFPITAVTSVKVDSTQGFGSETIISSSSYVVHLERGVIQSRAGPFVRPGKPPTLVNVERAHWTDSPRAVQVVYTAATSSVPADVKEAYALLIGHWYRQVKTQVSTNFVNLDRQWIGEMSQIFRYDSDVPLEVKSLLDAYRTPNV